MKNATQLQAKIQISAIYFSDFFTQPKTTKCEQTSFHNFRATLISSVFHSYGYMTNTKIKFILVVDSVNSAFRENEIRTIFRNIHNEYVNFISNPFVMPNEPIFSKYANRIPNRSQSSYHFFQNVRQKHPKQNRQLWLKMNSALIIIIKSHNKHSENSLILKSNCLS